MFGVSKEKKLATKIGKYLHFQIREALVWNGEEAGVRAVDMFTSAYIYSFIQSVAKVNGFDQEKYVDKFLKHICNGVMPRRLYEAVTRNAAALDISEGLERESVLRAREQFKNGVRAARADTNRFLTSILFGDDKPAHSLYIYLMGADEDGDLKDL